MSERPVPSISNDDDKELEALGYVPSFKREFSNLATVSPILSQNSLLDSDHF
jgi:hypothetical protein